MPELRLVPRPPQVCAVRDVITDGAPPRLVCPREILVAEGVYCRGEKVIAWDQCARPFLAVWDGMVRGRHHLLRLDGVSFGITPQFVAKVIGIVVDSAE